MKLHNVAQGSIEWLRLRAGIPTASELDNLISPTGEVRKGKMPETYLLEKLAERWLGMPLASGGSWAMEQGSILEEEAVPWLALHLDRDIHRVGFVTNDDGTFGASPDGMIADGAELGDGVEIKSPQPANHLKYLLAGECPPDYRLQVQGGMYATGAKEWVFCSYSRRFPKCVVLVERDEPLIELIAETVAAFTKRLDERYARLVEIAGGEPVRITVEVVDDPGQPF